jgi:hypothetical protein
MTVKQNSRPKLREKFKASVWCVADAEGVYAYLDVNSPRLKKKDWVDGDKVRVTIEWIGRERGAARKERLSRTTGGA